MVSTPDLQADLRAEYRRALVAHERAIAKLVASGVDRHAAYCQVPSIDFRRFAGLTCGAKSKRTGQPCKRTDLHDNGRCKFHGGLSTGPKSEAGKARTAQNLVRSLDTKPHAALTDADADRSARARHGLVRAEVRTEVPEPRTVEGDPSDRPEPTCTRARARAYSSPTTGEAIDATTQFTDGEQRRIERRVVYFSAKGVPKHEAAELARHLVLERDRVNELRDSGSCAECENWGGGSCLAEKEGAGVEPRPIQEVWSCWCARRPMP